MKYNNNATKHRLGIFPSVNILAVYFYNIKLITSTAASNIKRDKNNASTKIFLPDRIFICGATFLALLTKKDWAFTFLRNSGGYAVTNRQYFNISSITWLTLKMHRFWCVLIAPSVSRALLPTPPPSGRKNK